MLSPIKKEKEKELNNPYFISLSGYRILLIYSMLIDKPLTALEIQNNLNKCNDINKNLSIDTIRFYIKTLRQAGCEITKATKLNSHKYTITNHPLSFDISNEEIVGLFKVRSYIIENCSLKELEDFESFILKISKYINNQKTKENLFSLLIINKLNKKFYRELDTCCRNHNLIKISYLYIDNIIEVELLCQKIFIRSEKIYIKGINTRYNSVSFLPLNRILKISSININNKKFFILENCAVCELYDKNYIPTQNDEILEENENRFIIKFTEDNLFMLTQKILSFGTDCKVLYPKELNTEIKNKLKDMMKIYE